MKAARKADCKKPRAKCVSAAHEYAHTHTHICMCIFACIVCKYNMVFILQSSFILCESAGADEH